MAQKLMRSEEELCPRYKRIAVSNDNLNKSSESITYKTIKEEVVEKLKFMAKGETKGKPKYGMKILEAMLSQIIKESADNMNYLAKSKNTQSGAPIQGMGQGKGYMSKGGLEDNVLKMKKKNNVPRRKRTITVDDNILEDPD
ncbi:hypothetical protein Tco_0656994 [Tanacetum coccineum]|uniref:Uncharacterized protein n=1 Tax=Tanacetum coccineum TaxID=301880 RepID=A0ABQ4XB09_9ASTR